jgi:glycosyltransferase involved in cell wall biosynthesis
MAKPSLVILGTRGIPASHGGFETFAEKLALFLVGRGWHVAVYCQNEVAVVNERIRTSLWNGVELIHVDVASRGPRATLEFDWHCVRDAARRDSVSLVLGYNGAVFLPYLRLSGRKVLTNMDGIEWKRPKWSVPVRAWFWMNEWIAAWSSQRLVADHPAIADHVATRRPRSAIATIPYGGDPISETSEAPIRAMGLEPDGYLTSIARIEPDNNILTMVEAFSRKRRGFKLVVLGTLLPDNRYHAAVRAAASDEVRFPGAIYDAGTLRSLRFHARAYLHGHTVGGTNPSLVEALWAGNAVIAHDNPFNRGTAGPDQAYFTDADACERRIETAIADATAMRAAGRAARARAAEHFNWTAILKAYEAEIAALGGYAAVTSGVHDSAIAR